MGRERMSCTGSKAGTEEAVGGSRVQPVGRQVVGVLGRAQKQPHLSSDVKCREVKVCHLRPGSNLGKFCRGPVYGI